MNIVCIGEDHLLTGCRLQLASHAMHPSAVCTLSLQPNSGHLKDYMGTQSALVALRVLH